MLRYHNFKKYYYNFLAVDIPDLVVDKGIYRLIGTNGSGKTTFLKTLAGLLSFEGNIELDGVLLNNDPLLQRRLINYSEADPNFPPFLAGTDFLKLFTLTKGGPKNQVDEIVSSLKADYFINDPIGTYSAGMLKKLSIALAFLGKPQVILLDEPFANVDTESLELVYTLVNEQYKTLNCIFIIVTHQDLIPDAINFDGQIMIKNRIVSRVE